MLMRAAFIGGLAICAVSCQRSPDSVILCEWTQQRIDAVDHVTTLTDHVTYRADHTYVRIFEDPRRGVTNQSGTWRIEGHQIICWNAGYGEKRAEILRLTREDFQVTPPGAVFV